MPKSDVALDSYNKAFYDIKKNIKKLTTPILLLLLISTLEVFSSQMSVYIRSDSYNSFVGIAYSLVRFAVLTWRTEGGTRCQARQELVSEDRR